MFILIFLLYEQHNIQKISAADARWVTFTQSFSWLPLPLGHLLWCLCVRVIARDSETEWRIWQSITGASARGKQKRSWMKRAETAAIWSETARAQRALTACVCCESHYCICVLWCVAICTTVQWFSCSGLLWLKMCWCLVWFWFWDSGEKRC